MSSSTHKISRRNFVKSVAAVAAGSAARLKGAPLPGENPMENSTGQKKTNHEIKISTAQVKFVDMPRECNPYNKKFDRSAVGPMYVEKNIENSLSLIEKAGQMGSHVVCTTEDLKGIYSYIYHLDDPTIFSDFTEPVPGPLTERIGALAQKYNMYMVADYFERDGDSFYNTASLIGPTGKLVGKYRKLQIPGGESWRVKGGQEASVFDTDFGRVGFLICYDIIFPEITALLALRGADIIFHPTAGFGWTEILGEATVVVRANDHSVSIVVSKSWTPNGPGRSCIVNDQGQIIADAGYEPNVVVSAVFDPRKERLQSENGFGTWITGVQNLRARLLLERRPEVYSALGEKRPPLAARYQQEKLLTDQGEAQLRKVYERFKKQWQWDAEHELEGRII